MCITLGRRCLQSTGVGQVQASGSGKLKVPPLMPFLLEDSYLLEGERGRKGVKARMRLNNTSSSGAAWMGCKGKKAPKSKVRPTPPLAAPKLPNPSIKPIPDWGRLTMDNGCIDDWDTLCN